jgi:NAD(P)-dependent dehydrogenase (short-subunit alcohol dehydrogenase family)
MAEYFAAQGATILGCGRDSEALATLSAKLGTPHAFSVVDVADDSQVRHWARGILDTHDAPDLLINNAAMINRSAPLWELESAEIESLLRTNLLGVTNCIHYFVPEMLRRSKGVIVNFSSGWGRSTSPEVASYCASKWAVEGLTQSLAQDLSAAGGTVAAVALNPGIIDTQMLRSCLGDSATHYPGPEDWVRRAGPFILGLRRKDNGRSLDVPSS